MDFKEREVDFQGADRRYAELTRLRDAGSISEEEFDALRQRLMVRDDQGRWWAKLGESGEWHYRDDKTWIRGTPPGYREEVLPESTNTFEEVDRRYAQLKRLHHSGEITQEEFDEQLKRSMVQDQRGRWWGKSRKSGGWHYHDGSAWVRGTPLGYAPPTRDDQNRETQYRRAGLLIVALCLGLLVVFVGVAVGTVMLGYKLPTLLHAGALVPDLEGEGKTLSEAVQLVGGDYELEVTDVRSSSEPKGTVIWSSFPPDRALPEGREDPRVHLTLSGGQGSVAVPDVSGLSAVQAGKALIDAGLGPDVHVIFDQSGNAVAAIKTSGTYQSEKDVSGQKISSTAEEAGSVVPAGEDILLKTEGDKFLR
jgi:beta-lactam-binding protein with PASTA domain